MMKADKETRKRAWGGIVTLLLVVFLSVLAQTHSLLDAACGTLCSAPALFVFPALYMWVRRGTGSDVLAAAATLGAGAAFIAGCVWLGNLLFVR